MPPTHANFRSQSGLWEITEQANSNSHIYEVWGTVTTKPKPNFQLECLLRDELWSHHNPFLEYLFTWNSWNSITHWACHSFNLNTSPIWLNCSYHGSQSHYSADKLICWELPLLTFHPKVDKAKLNNHNCKEFLEIRGDIMQSIGMSFWKVAKDERISFNPKQLPLWKFIFCIFYLSRSIWIEIKWKPYDSSSGGISHPLELRWSHKKYNAPSSPALEVEVLVSCSASEEEVGQL